MRELFYAFISLTIIYNPFSKPPQLLSLTSDLNDDERNTIANRATAIAWLIGVFAVLFGSLILDVLAIHLSSFRIFGGLMLLFFGIQFGLGYSLNRSSKSRGMDVAAVPLASPLLAGPGAISALMLLTIDYGSAITVIAMSLCLLVCLLFMRFSKIISDLLNEQTVKVISRLMGMIMVAIAVQFITSGLSEIK